MESATVRPFPSSAGGQTVAEAVGALANGGMAVVIDDTGTERVACLVTAAEQVSWESVSFIVRHTAGFLCVAIAEQRADELGLPSMVPARSTSSGPVFAITVDAREGVTTGISARDRATTARLLAADETAPDDLARPGHIVPVRAANDGLLERHGKAEAAVDLCRLAGLRPAAVLCDVVSDDGSMPARPMLLEFADEHHLPVVTVSQLSAYRLRQERTVIAAATSTMPTSFGSFTARAYRGGDGTEHVAMIFGDPSTVSAPLVRIHSECLTGDALFSQRCDCGAQLQESLRSIAEAGAGVVVYLRGHEGRGVGLAVKIAAYGLQDEGYDTVDANLALGMPVDGRHYVDGALILHDIGVRRVRLLTNNPDKCTALAEAGIQVVQRVPLRVAPTPDNITYLRAKAARMGHLIGDLGNGA